MHTDRKPNRELGCFLWSGVAVLGNGFTLFLFDSKLMTNTVTREE